MAFRFATSSPRTLEELFQRIRELLPQLEPRVMADVEVGTQTTAIAHGLQGVPRFYALKPHCLAMWCEAKIPDTKNVYVRASNLVVCDLLVIP